MEYQPYSNSAPTQSEIEKAFKEPTRFLLVLSTLHQLASTYDLDSDVEDQVKEAFDGVVNHVVSLLDELNRIGFVSVVNDENLPPFSLSKDKLVINISGSNVEHGARP